MIPVAEDVLINAVEKVSKSVVNIASVRMLHDQLFRVFPVEGVGSGVVIDEKGYILTNNHVIDDAERLKITLPDGTVLRGKVVGSDETTDLAVVKTIRGCRQQQSLATLIVKGRSNSDCNWQPLWAHRRTCSYCRHCQFTE